MVIFFTVLAIFVLIGCSAFFSGSETALTAASRSRMHLMAEEGNWRAKVVNFLLARSDRLIGALLLGNNLVNILASAIATNASSMLLLDGTQFSTGFSYVAPDVEVTGTFNGSQAKDDGPAQSALIPYAHEYSVSLAQGC